MNYLFLNCPWLVLLHEFTQNIGFLDSQKMRRYVRSISVRIDEHWEVQFASFKSSIILESKSNQSNWKISKSNEVE